MRNAKLSTGNVSTMPKSVNIEIFVIFPIFEHDSLGVFYGSQSSNRIFFYGDCFSSQKSNEEQVHSHMRTECDVSRVQWIVHAFITDVP